MHRFIVTVNTTQNISILFFVCLYCQLFTHESNYISVLKVHTKRHSNQWEKNPTISLSPWGTWAWAHPLTTLNDSSIALGSRTFAQLRHTVPIGYNWTPTLTPKILPSPWPISTHLIHPSVDWPNSPFQTASRSAVFPQFTYRTHRLTNRLTYGLGNKPVRIPA